MPSQTERQVPSWCLLFGAAAALIAVGYGLDGRQLYRNLPGICALDE